MDVNRLASAIRGPGIDTRCWVSLAIAQDDSVVEAAEAPKGGVFVDVKLFPTGEDATARVTPLYAGSGFGFYAKIKKDDEVVVLIPSGILAEGAVLIGRTWSAADTPPQQAIDDPEEVMFVVEPEKNVRLSLSGGGELRVRVGDNTVFMTEDLIEWGAEGADDKASLDSKVQAELSTAKANAQAAVDFANQIKSVFSSGVAVPQDGGAAIQAAQVLAATAIIAPVLTSPSATNSELVTIDK